MIRKARCNAAGLRLSKKLTLFRQKELRLDCAHNFAP